MIDTVDDVASRIRDLDRRVEELVRVDGKEALALADTAVALSTDADDFHAGVAQRARAHALRLLGRYAEAASDYTNAVAQFSAVGNETEVARTLIGKTDALIYLGDYRGALDAARRARGVLRVAGDVLAVAKLDMNVGNIHFRLGEQTVALRHYRRAQRVFALLDDELHRAGAEANVGNALAQLDRFDAALRALRRARARYVRLELPLMVATIDLNIGYVWSCRGNYLTALDHLYRARRIFGQQEAWSDVATTDLDIAESYLALNMLPEVVEIAQTAAQQFETEGMRHERGQALVCEATALARLGGDQASDLLLAARSIFEAEQNRVWCALIDLRLSALADDLHVAAHLAGRAEQAFREMGLERRAAESRLALGRALVGLGDADRAHALFVEVDETAGRLGLAELRFRTLHERARLLRSLPLYRQALAQFEQLRLALGAEILKISFVAGEWQLYGEMLDLLLQAGGDIDEIFVTAEASRARALTDAIARSARRNRADRSRIDTQREHLRERLRSLHVRLRMAELCARVDEVAYLQTEVVSVERQFDDHVRASTVADALGTRRSAGRLIRLQEVRERLTPDQLLVTYFGIQDRVGAIVIGHDRAELHDALSTTSEIAAIIAKVCFQNNACARRGEDWVREHQAALLGDLHVHLRLLYDRLLGPISLESEKQLIIVPHGPLHAVPFHALQSARGALIDQYETVIAPSATAAWGTEQIAMATGPPLVLGVADAQAPMAEEEAREIARLLQVRPCVGPAATVDLFRRRAPRARIVHLSGHATLRADNPAFSAVHLGDGPLAAHDVDELGLGAELAVLSGCVTGVGAVRRGDEVMSLARSFLAAGVRRLLVSLWPVWDRTTRELMTCFYDQLRSGTEPATALRFAQLRLRADHPHPYYWAPFTVVGA